jgi:hypothetical protein
VLPSSQEVHSGLGKHPSNQSALRVGGAQWGALSIQECTVGTQQIEGRASEWDGCLQESLVLGWEGSM